MITKFKIYGESWNVFSDNEEIEIDCLIKELQAIQGNYRYIRVSLKEDYYGATCEITPYCEESEESYQNRVRKEKEETERRKESAKKP